MDNVIYMNDYKSDYSQKMYVQELVWLENHVRTLTAKSLAGWEQYRKVLMEVQKDKKYWDSPSTQESLLALAHKIDERRCEMSPLSNPENLKERLEDFLRGVGMEEITVRWDIPYYLDFSLMETPLREMVPLYPEDILGLLVVLERKILFYSEEERQRRYINVHRQIMQFENHFLENDAVKAKEFFIHVPGESSQVP